MHGQLVYNVAIFVGVLVSSLKANTKYKIQCIAILTCSIVSCIGWLVHMAPEVLCLMPRRTPFSVPISFPCADKQDPYVIVRDGDLFLLYADKRGPLAPHRQS